MMHPNPKYAKGTIHESRNYGKYEVVNYRGARDIEIRFLDTGGVNRCCTSNIDTGRVKDFLKPSIYGQGYVGQGNHAVTYRDENGKKKNTVCYDAWRDMIRRCYDPKRQEQFPTYKGVEVCEEWKCFQTFADWWYEYPYKGDGWHLEKDIIDPNCRIYSPETAAYVPPEINMFVTCKRDRKGYKRQGVFEVRDGRWLARVGNGKRNEQLTEGPFASEREAFERYSEMKCRRASKLAEQYKGVVDPRIIERLVNYKVEIVWD